MLGNIVGSFDGNLQLSQPIWLHWLASVQYSNFLLDSLIGWFQFSSIVFAGRQSFVLPFNVLLAEWAL